MDIVTDPFVVSQAQELVKTLVLGLLGLLGTVFGVAILWVRTQATEWFNAKIEKAKSDAKTAESAAHYEAFRCFTERLTQLATKAVDEVEQTMVRELKADKKWNVDTARKARDTAVEIMVRHAGEDGLKELQHCGKIGLDALMGMFRTYVESEVVRRGSSTPANAIGPKPVVVPMNGAALEDTAP